MREDVQYATIVDLQNADKGNGNSFIGHIRGTSSYFIGNVRGDSIYLFDHEESAHINYRISGCVMEHENGSTVCNIC